MSTAVIDGRHVTAHGGTRRLTDPATGRPGPEVADGDQVDVDLAVAAARRVHDEGTWRLVPPRGRIAVLLRLADLVEQHADELASLDSEDSGRPLRELREGDLPGAVESLRYFAEATDKLTSTAGPAGPEHHLDLSLREPVGVGAAILPWNFPLAMAAWKVGPALASGCPLVLKPADATPRSALRLADLAHDAGLPPGVLQVVPGSGPVTGAALSHHDGVDALSFTGSTATGRRVLAAAAASNFKRVSLEMGGKSPQVVFADAPGLDDRLLDHLLEAGFSAGGQNCTAGSRILVEESVLDRVRDGLLERVAGLRVGHPADPATDVGPLVSHAARDRVEAAVRRAVHDGARVLLGGTRVLEETGGAYYCPTVLDRVGPHDRVEQEELFGPVVTLSSFRTEAEALARANCSAYGLAASVWTSDLDRALRCSAALEAGIVSVNAYSEGGITTPFGGFGLSGSGGKEKSLAAFEQWQRTKSVWVARTGAVT